MYSSNPRSSTKWYLWLAEIVWITTGVLNPSSSLNCFNKVGVNVNKGMYKILNLVMYNFIHY